MNHKEVLDQYEDFAEAESENRDRWLEDLKFGFSDQQWPDALRNSRETDPDGARPCLTVNKIPAHARQILNDMRQSRASVKIIPADSDADVETAEVMQGMVRHIEHVSNADIAYSVAAEYQVMMGLGYFRIDTEYVDPRYNEQELRINSIRNPFSVYMDPWIHDPTGADASACYVTGMMSRKAFEAKWPKADIVDVQKAGTMGRAGWWTENSVRTAEYFWLEDVSDVYVMSPDGIMLPADEYDGSLGEGREIRVPRKQLKWQLVSGAEVLEESDKLGRYIPIIRVVGEEIDIDGERVTHGIVRRARDAQQMYNFTVSAIAERNALQPKAPWLVAHEGIEGHEDQFQIANVKNIPYLTYNAYTDDGSPVPPPQRQFPSGADMALIQQMAGAEGDIQATIGRFEANLGAPSNEKSGAAIRARQSVGDIATYHYPDNLGRAIRQCGRVLVDLIPLVYDSDRVARVLGEDGEADYVRLSPDIPGAREEYEANGKIEKIYNLGVGTYDVAVSVGPSYNTKRQEAFDAMAQMTQGNPQLWGVIGDLLVKNMDWPGAQEMAKRLKATIPPEIRQDEEMEDMDPEVLAKFQEMAAIIEQGNAQMQELAQQNSELQQTVSGKVIEMQMKQEDHAAKMAELEQERIIKQMEFEQKQQEILLKREEAEAKLMQQADRNASEYSALTELVATAHAGAENTQAILTALAEATQQQGEMLAAMLGEMAKPKQLSVSTDAEGNVIGGVSQSIN